MLNVRLDKDTEKKLQAYTTDHDVSKSHVVKEALALYLSREEKSNYPFALGEDLFGTESSGVDNNSTSYKSKLKSKLNEKYAR